MAPAWAGARAAERALVMGGATEEALGLVLAAQWGPARDEATERLLAEGTGP